MIFIWGIDDQTVPFAPAISHLNKHFNETSIVVFPGIKHIATYDINSPAFISLSFLETSDQIGIPIKNASCIDYFYNQTISMAPGLNFTYRGEEYDVSFDPDLFPEFYVDFY